MEARIWRQSGPCQSARFSVAALRRLRYRPTLMSVIDKLEKALGRFAIPGLVAILAALQAGVWLLARLQPHSQLLEMLVLNPQMVRQGELWRLITWVVVTPGLSMIWLFFQLMLMFLMSHALDAAWGAFRTNLYIFGGIFFVAAGVMLFGDSSTVVIGSYLDSSLIFAFAFFHPDFELLLFFILPLKMKYIALLFGGGMFLDFVKGEQSRLVIVLSLLNFGIAFGGYFWSKFQHGAQVSTRRRRFEADQRPNPDALTLHKCHSCGKTDADDPTLDFRVGADGHDYCSVCRQNLQAPKA